MPASSAQAKRAGSAGSFVNYHEDIMGFSSPCSLIDRETRALAAAVLAQAVEDATIVALWPVSGIVHETWERDLWLELGAWFLDGEDGAEWFGGGIWQTLVGIVHSRAQAHAVSWKRTKNKQYGAVWGTWTERNAVEAEREAWRQAHPEGQEGQEAYAPPVRKMPSSDHYTTPAPLSRQFLQRNYGPKISILFCSDALDMEPSTILRLTAQRIIQTAIRTTFLRARQVAMAEIVGRRPGDLFGDDWIALPSEEWFSPGARGIPLFEVFHGTGRAGGGVGGGEGDGGGIQQDQVPFTMAWCCRHARIDPDVLRGRVAESLYASVELESEEWREVIEKEKALKGEDSKGWNGEDSISSVLSMASSASNRASMTLDAELDLRGILGGGMRLADMDRRMKEEAAAKMWQHDGEEPGKEGFEEQIDRQLEQPDLPLPSLEDHIVVRAPAVEAILAMELQRWRQCVAAEMRA